MPKAHQAHTQHADTQRTRHAHTQHADTHPAHAPCPHAACGQPPGARSPGRRTEHRHTHTSTNTDTQALNGLASCPPLPAHLALVPGSAVQQNSCRGRSGRYRRRPEVPGAAVWYTLRKSEQGARVRGSCLEVHRLCAPQKQMFQQRRGASAKGWSQHAAACKSQP